jgi:predicted transcriptional regulator of viral defense system
MIEKIKYTIDKFPFGFVFTADDFPVTVENPKGVSKALNKFVKEGYLRKLSKGRFYKPQIGKYRELPPDTYQSVKDLLEKEGKTIGYINGYSAFNDLMLTTQVPSVLQIGMRKEKKPSFAVFIVFTLSGRKTPLPKRIFP